MTVRVAVDWNEWDGERLVTAIANADGPLSAGAEVLLVDPLDGISMPGTVASIDEGSGSACFQVAWGQFRGDPEAADDPACE